MKCWILIKYYGYGEYEIDKVFASKEKANAEKERLKKEDKLNLLDFDICEYEVIE